MMVEVVVMVVMILVISLPGILHMSCPTGFGEDYCDDVGVGGGDGCDGGGGGEGGVVDGDDDIVDKIARMPGVSSTGFGEDYVDVDVEGDDMVEVEYHENHRFSYSLLKHHGYIDWRTVGMRECYWCTLDITETVGQYFDTTFRICNHLYLYLVFLISSCIIRVLLVHT